MMSSIPWRVSIVLCMWSFTIQAAVFKKPDIFKYIVKNEYLKIEKILQKDKSKYLEKRSKYSGKTPLIYAASLDNYALVRLFTSYGADINISDNEGLTSLMYGAKKGSLNIVKHLMIKKALSDLQSNEGNSAFMYAVIGNHQNVVEYLLSKGVKLLLKNKENHNAYALACKYKRKEIEKTLRLTGVYKTEDSKYKKLKPNNNNVDDDRPSDLKDLVNIDDLSYFNLFIPKRPIEDYKMVKFTSQMDAYEVFNNLHVQGTTFDSTPLHVLNGHSANGGVITYGGEKEGKTSRITHVATPRSGVFWDYIQSLSDNDSEIFLKNFLGGLKNKKYIIEDVFDVDGNKKDIDYSFLDSIDTNTLDRDSLVETFEDWLDQTEDHPFSFLKQRVRRYIFNGCMPSGKDCTEERAGQALLRLTGKLRKIENYNDPHEDVRMWDWLPHFGYPEEVISKIVNSREYKEGEYSGWEINSKVFDSYGGFEEFISWFRKNMAISSKNLFSSLGHQRMVFPKIKTYSTKESKEIEGKVSEVYKNIQAYILLKTIANGTSIMTQWYQPAISDYQLYHDTSKKGVIRKENDRWEENTRGLELRAGMKNIETQRFIQKMLAARVATNDWSGIVDIKDWRMIPAYLSTNKVSETKNIDTIAERFNLGHSDIVDFLYNVAKLEIINPKWDETGRLYKYRQNTRSLIFLWNWEQAPYLSSLKKEILKKLTKDLILYVNSNSNSKEKVSEAIRKWTKTSNLDLDIKHYLMPERKVKNNEIPPHFYLFQGNKRVVDVNKIYMGMEYTARFPLHVDLSISKGFVYDKNVDLTTDERNRVIYDVAASLRKNLGFSPSTRIYHEESISAHGHGLSIAYYFYDPDDKSRKWRVEWDGIARSYDRNGNVIFDSERGGHLELVTPKFVPTYRELEAVYKSFRQNSVVPKLTAGAGHINIDLKEFEKRPWAMARLLNLFHKHRGIMAMLFQHVRRVRTSEPADITEDFHRTLLNFSGSSEQLKEFLYNSGYFNKRIGRKTRYLQLDISSYYQDVIPEEFILEDFDIMNPTVPWRQQFRVCPHIRKMEFRMFDAPRSPYEAAMQIKLVRALLNKALNDNSTINGPLQKVDHKAYVNDPDKAFHHLVQMTKELGLNFQGYKGYLGESISKAEVAMAKDNYKSVEEKLEDYDELPMKYWNTAVKGRGHNDGIDCKKKEWTGYNKRIPVISKFNSTRIQNLRKNNSSPSYYQQKIKENRRFRRSHLPHISL